MKHSDPKTLAEWQEAVDAAAALRVLADVQMYGLIEGGPSVNVHRCDHILKHGRIRGVLPSAPPDQLAIQMIERINSKAKTK